MISLGIDASYNNSGLVWYGDIIDQPAPSILCYKKLRFPPGPKRLFRAMIAIKSEMDKSPYPDVYILEDTIWTRTDKNNDLLEVSVGRRTIKMLHELNAIYKVLIQSRDVEPLEVEASLVKRWLTGSGAANKALVAQELRQRYSISFEKDSGFDLSDAAVLAIWGYHQRRKDQPV